MSDILCVTASARHEGSRSRQLAETFLDQWRASRPSDRITIRDVGLYPPPSVDQSWIEAAFAAPGERTPAQTECLAVSDRLIDEVAAASIVIIATPMYNYGMPASLKAWVDQVVRVNRTFTFDLARGDFPLEPTLNGKIAIFLTATGEFGFEDGGVRAGQDHLVPHLRTVSPYLGVAESHHIRIAYQEFGDERHAASVATAHEDAKDLANRLARDMNARTARGDPLPLQ